MTIERILLLSEKKLPGWDGQREMSPTYRSEVNLEDLDELNPRRAGVLVHLFPGDHGLEVLYMKRPESGSNHGGQVSFPGGMFEKGDKNLRATALREAHEEVGLAVEGIQVVRDLSWLYIPPSNFYVEPTLSIGMERPSLVLSQDEVAYTFSIPLAELVAKKYHSEVPIQTKYGRMKVPAIDYHGEIIWGATAMITAELIRLVR
ncbi:MAG: hypothetical protein RL754_224 [Bacteroidota bacterium]|jgi:8-oxo-dGTP pyrophosphatase MutT (NUDIX family)